MKSIGMVLIPSGSFVMGSPEGEGEASEHPQHQVNLDSFSIDVTPITQEAYLELMKVNPSIYKGATNLPVENVTWYDAVLYCNARSLQDGLEPVYQFSAVKGDAGNGCEWLEDLKIDFNKVGYRLPTEAEWEYACRAGTTTRYYWGGEMDGEFAWWEKNSGERTQPVGLKKPNAWDLHDMCGNIQEWCQDWFGQDYYAVSPPDSPKGSDFGELRVLRGGSWYPYQDGGAHLRSANRSCHHPDYRRDAYGFRCVLPKHENNGKSPT